LVQKESISMLDRTAMQIRVCCTTHMVVEAVCQLSLVTYVRLQLAPIFQTDYAISFVECIPRKTYLQHAVSSTTLMDFFFVITSLRK
jgi:hypothetical protein